jgi:hypothetical protein
MRTILLALVLITAPLSAVACQTLPPEEQRELDRLDTERQRDLVTETASDADLIVIARVVSISTDHDTATFLVTRSIKGNVTGELSLTLDQTIHIGCYPSAFFFAINLEPGGSYILYSKGGKALRAGSNDRSFGEISLRQELRLIRKQMGPNNSFKPKPLRGSA